MTCKTPVLPGYIADLFHPVPCLRESDVVRCSCPRLAAVTSSARLRVLKKRSAPWVIPKRDSVDQVLAGYG